MKNFVKSFMAVTLFALTLSLASCGDDDYCFECTGSDDGMGTVLEDLGTICEGDTDGGDVASREDIDQAVALYVAFGGTCNKK